MDNMVTVEHALEAAVAAEGATEALFHGLEARLAPVAGLAAFWKEYALFEPNAETANFLRAQSNSHSLKLATSLPAVYPSRTAQRTVPAVG